MGPLADAPLRDDATLGWAHGPGSDARTAKRAGRVAGVRYGGRVIVVEAPAIDSQVHFTARETPYLRAPGVALLAAPTTNLQAMATFLAGFEPTLGFGRYLDDPTPLPAPEQLCKAAGQLCYASFGPRRTWNAEAEKYIRQLKAAGHGSVLEHANFSLLLYGVSRSLTHELVRHRVGTAFSQLSQRYVSGSVLRFVERPEYRDDPELHELFCQRIDAAATAYARLTDLLLQRQREGRRMLAGTARTDLRKKVQQCSRSLLPNETEAPLVMTANARAWRHIIEMRASPHAESEIRELALGVYRVLRRAAPLLFGDYEEETLADGSVAVSTPYPKV